MTSIAENIQLLKTEIPSKVKLVAISKTNSSERIWEAYSAGQKIFGENKVQELVPKFDTLPKDIEWHMVGHLQSNKVKYIAPFISLIHSVDSLNLLQEINKQALKYNRIIPCLLQVYIATEETKFGLSETEVNNLVQSEAFWALKNVDVVGLMGMASFTDNTELIRTEFKHLFKIFNNLKNNYFGDKASFKEISMGMSSDFQIAIEEGSTMIRVGSRIFGERNY